MPVGAVQAPLPINLDADEVEAIQRCLVRIPEDERQGLYQSLEGLDRLSGHTDEVYAFLGNIPAGPIRQCLQVVARRRRGAPQQAGPRVAGASASPRAKPYRVLRGVIAPAGTWAQKSPWYWWQWEPDAFSHLDWSSRTPGLHVPIPLYWKHRQTHMLGMSTLFTVNASGDLVGDFMVSPSPLGQMAAQLAADGLLGLSLGSRAETGWAVVVPAEKWDPYAAKVDLAERFWPEPIEVSLGPDPVFTDARVTYVD